MKRTAILLALAATLTTFSANAQEEAYREPSQDVKEMILAQPLPKVTMNNDLTKGVLYETKDVYQPLSYIASINEFKVAGLRLNGDNFSQTRKKFYTSLKIVDVATGAVTEIAGMPDDPHFHDIKWSPAGKYFCFLNDCQKEVELYRVDVTAAEPRAVKINENRVNCTTKAEAYEFLDEETVLYRSVPKKPGAFPVKGNDGPVIDESFDKKGTYRTYQDLLHSKYDEDVFEYLCSGYFSVYDGNRTRTVGKKQIVRSYSVSPDGKHIIVNAIRKPFLYSKPIANFLSRTAIVEVSSGKEIKVLRPVKTEPGAPERSDWAWRGDKGSVLTWVETTKEKSRNTSLCQCEAPFDLSTKQVLCTPEFKFTSVLWGNDHVALYTDSSSELKVRRTFAFDPSDKAGEPVLLYSEDRRHLISGISTMVGDIAMERGRNVIKLDKKSSYVFLTGSTRPDENGDNMSFIDKIMLKDGKTTNVWMAKAPYKTSVISFKDNGKKGMTILAIKESAVEIPNYVEITLDKKGRTSERAVTAFVNPIPHFDQLRYEYITYKRADGLNCAARVFLPADYDKKRDGKLPVFLWTYPREHKTVYSAERNYRADRYAFQVPSQFRQYCWCMKGYAVVLDWTMAILSESEGKEPNEVFVNQLVMSAEAIINALDEAGIGDRNRMSVGGISYGAFMTGNLLAHTNLFKAGFANSGAYNRTLTPYGFQHENRDYWEIPEVYATMSPFNYADRIKTPMIMTHGQMDENTGTHPIQSERLYYAIVGNGGTARYLQLPYEGHVMQWKENVLHYFHEVENGLEKYVKYPGTTE